MVQRAHSRLRTFAGLVLAILVAPVTTAAYLSVEMAVGDLLGRQGATISVGDLVGGSLTILLLALLFGSVLALVPGLFFGGLAIAVARSIETRSPVFFSTAGLLAGLFMAWVDTKRTGAGFDSWAALPFVVGGFLSGLTYWAAAER